MEDEALDPAPIWCGDLADLDCAPFAGRVDLVTAGFPCQPWSVAGKREGKHDDRWIWPGIARIIREVRPGLVFLENVRGLVSGGGLEPVLGDLAGLGFDAEWTCLRASEVGAPHRRERVFVLAYRECAALRDESGRICGSGGSGSTQPGHSGEDVADADARRQSRDREPERTGEQCASWSEPVGCGANGGQQGAVADAPHGESRDAGAGRQTPVDTGDVGDADRAGLEERRPGSEPTSLPPPLAARSWRRLVRDPGVALACGPRTTRTPPRTPGEPRRRPTRWVALESRMARGARS